jgi:hypothetical protein
MDHDVGFGAAIRFGRRLLIAHCGLLVHYGLLQMNVNALRVESLPARQFKQRLEDITTRFRRIRSPCDAEVVTATGYFHAQAGFDLSKMFVELAAEVGQTLIVGGLENDVP